MTDVIRPAKTRRLLIVDSNLLLVTCWKRFFVDLPLEVEAVTTLADAIDRFLPDAWAANPFDIVFLDLTLADGSGCDLLPLAAMATPRPRVAVIASELDGTTALSIADQCDIVVPKPLDRSGVMNVLRRLFRGESYGEVVLEFARHYRLSERETQLVLGAVQGLSNDEIAAELSCDRSTVGTYWTRIFRKTATNSQRGVLALIIRSSEEKKRFALSGVRLARYQSEDEYTPLDELVEERDSAEPGL